MERIDYYKITVENMTKLGTYKSEYDRIIDIYAGMNAEYDVLQLQYENTGRQYMEQSRTGGDKRTPIVMMLETLRKDILAYSDRLCLNPKSVSKEDMSDNKAGKLDNALMELTNASKKAGKKSKRS